MTDACSQAAGGYFHGDWFYFNFSVDNPNWAAMHINHKETLAIVLAAQRWAPRWVHQRVLIHSDNQAAVQIINKGTTGNAQIMQALRALFWLSAIYNFHLSAIYIEGSRNTIADAVSRLHECGHLASFYSILCDKFPRTIVDDMVLSDHMSVDSNPLLFSRCLRPPASVTTPSGSPCIPGPFIR